MIRRSVRTFAVFTCLSAVTLAPALGRAAEPEKQPRETKDGETPKASDPAAAQALFYEARALMQKGRYAEACPKLEESLRLDHGIGTAYNLADCNEHIGKLATAWSGFLDVAAQSKAAGQAQRERVARDRAQKLEPRLPKLVVDVRTAPPGLTVERDGVALGAAAYGTAIPVDPGAHKVVASAPGRTPFETTVETKEGKTARVVVADLPLTPPPAVAVTATPPPESPPPNTVGTGTTTTTSASTIDAAFDAPPTTSFPEPEMERSSPQRTIGWVVLGAGVAGVATSGYFGLRSLGKRNESRDNCNGDLCDARGVELRDDAIRAGNAATIAGIAGGAAIVGGLVLVLTSPKDTRRAALPPTPRVGKITARPEVGPFGAGFVLGGTLP